MEKLYGELIMRSITKVIMVLSVTSLTFHFEVFRAFLLAKST